MDDDVGLGMGTTNFHLGGGMVMNRGFCVFANGSGHSPHSSSHLAGNFGSDWVGFWLFGLLPFLLLFLLSLPFPPFLLFSSLCESEPSRCLVQFAQCRCAAVRMRVGARMGHVDPGNNGRGKGNPNKLSAESPHLPQSLCSVRITPPPTPITIRF